MQIPQDLSRENPCLAQVHQQFVASEIEPGIREQQFEIKLQLPNCKTDLWYIIRAYTCAK